MPLSWFDKLFRFILIVLFLAGFGLVLYMTGFNEGYAAAASLMNQNPFAP